MLSSVHISVLAIKEKQRISFLDKMKQQGLIPPSVLNTQQSDKMHEIVGIKTLAIRQQKGTVISE